MILCADADPDAREESVEALTAAGFDTVGCASVPAARDVLDGDGRVDCVVTEAELAEGTGLELLRETREREADAACVLFTDTPAGAVDTTDFGDVVVEYLAKDDPDARRELVSLVEHAVGTRSQTAYPLPDDEADRLAALEAYASDPEAVSASLDRLTAVATALFDADAAAIGLVDAHEERFLACHGTSFEPLDREATICTYAILDGEVTVVESVPDDPRFADNALLVDDDVRFYAGAPLVTPEGRPIGTFCVYDDEPREFPDRERELLSMLADEVVDRLSLRRAPEDTGEGP